MRYQLVGAGDTPAPIPLFAGIECVASDEHLSENIRSALGRGLPLVEHCRPHQHILSIIGGGPSIEDTYREAAGYIAAVNKAHDWLIERGVIPNACGLVDPLPALADQITPRKDVTYFVASMCDPRVFDKLKGYHVKLWHALPCPVDVGDVLRISGGTTIALRWFNLGYICGFRTFHLHGMDSSVRGARHHAYEHRQDDALTTFEAHGYETQLGLCTQISDFFTLLKRLELDDVDPVRFKVFGDGLLQHLVRLRYPTMTFQTKET